MTIDGLVDCPECSHKLIPCEVGDHECPNCRAWIEVWREEGDDGVWHAGRSVRKR